MGKKRKLGQRLVTGILFCFVVFWVLAFYANMLQKGLNEEIIGKLKEVAEQSVVTLCGEIDGESAILEEVADRFSGREKFDVQAAVQELKKISERHSFKRMGVILPDGLAYTTDDKELELGDREFFQESMQGKVAVSNRLKDKVDDDFILVFSVPVYEQDQVCAVMFATYCVEELEELLGVFSFGGEGYSYVVSQNGELVIDTAGKTGFSNMENVYKSMRSASESNIRAAAELKEGMENGSTGYIQFHNKVDKYMYYSPLGIRDWYVLNVVPAGVMDSTRNFIMLITYVLCGVLAAAFVALVSYIIKMEREKKKELSDILYVDAVTGGYSYARFCVEAPECIKKTDKNIAYIIMDIDKFKVINELFGYEDGNRTLRYVWSIWKKCSRENEIFARRISDRFVALWYFDSREELNGRIENFREELEANLIRQSTDYVLKITMGIYLVEDKTAEVQKMQNYAVMAHSTVKGREDIWYAFYDTEFREKLLQSKMLEDQMKRALRHSEFVVYYQPKYSVMTKKLVGAEALVRWKKEDGSIIMPGKFIPLAEENGFINYLDKYIFTNVCTKQKQWIDEGKQVMPVSVNLSRRHLYNDAFMEEYKSIVDGTKVPPEYVQLELTESAIFENQEELCRIIDQLHLMGFRILMDDFGTGYSSLMMLKSVPIDILKLDKSFVDDFDDARGEKIITSVIKLAQALHIEVTAEGVETAEQYEFLRGLGCNMVQGFYFAKPMPEEEYGKLLQEI